MAKVMESKTPYGSDVRTTMDGGGKKPDMKDYRLSGIEGEPAENGIIVKCRYQIKDDVKAAMRKKERYCDSYMEPKQHIFEDYDGVLEFVQKEIGRLKA